MKIKKDKNVKSAELLSMIGFYLSCIAYILMASSIWFSEVKLSWKLFITSLYIMFIGIIYWVGGDAYAKKLKEKK